MPGWRLRTGHWFLSSGKIPSEKSSPPASRLVESLVSTPVERHPAPEAVDRHCWASSPSVRGREASFPESRTMATAPDGRFGPCPRRCAKKARVSWSTAELAVCCCCGGPIAGIGNHCAADITPGGGGGGWYPGAMGICIGIQAGEKGFAMGAPMPADPVDPPI